MVIFRQTADIQNYLTNQTHPGRKIGFVPTMGALHQGHLSLISRSRQDGLLTVCSIFVNPTQFNDKSDFEKYPISTGDDVELLGTGGCDVLFLPSSHEVYPEGADAAKTFDFGYLDTILEGEKRPGHFRGVGQVVARLLDIVKPTVLYLGQKDYQQCMVISKLISLLGIDTTLQICPTAREADGLAMSSRNRRLTESQRAIAGIIYQCLVSIQSKQDEGNFSIVKKECEDLLTAKGFKPEYIALASANDLTLMDNYRQDTPMVALIASWLGDVRLIDNVLLN